MSYIKDLTLSKNTPLGFGPYSLWSFFSLGHIPDQLWSLIEAFSFQVLY